MPEYVFNNKLLNFSKKTSLKARTSARGGVVETYAAQGSDERNDENGFF